jgi:hypothetical protein
MLVKCKVKSTFGEIMIRVGWSHDNVVAYEAILMTLIWALQFDDVVGF